MREACCPVPPKKNPEVGRMYEGPALSQSAAGGRDICGTVGEIVFPSSMNWSPVIYVSDMVNCSCRSDQQEAIVAIQSNE